LNAWGPDFHPHCSIAKEKRKREKQKERKKRREGGREEGKDRRKKSLSTLIIRKIQV
jgi:hypothetical protein